MNPFTVKCWEDRIAIIVIVVIIVNTTSVAKVKKKSKLLRFLILCIGDALSSFRSSRFAIIVGLELQNFLESMLVRMIGKYGTLLRLDS